MEVSSLSDIDRVLAELDPSVRAIVAPIVTILRVIIEGLQEQLARAEARNEQLVRIVYGRRSEHVPDPKREAKRRARSTRTPEEREAARQDARGADYGALRASRSPFTPKRTPGNPRLRLLTRAWSS